MGALLFASHCGRGGASTMPDAALRDVLRRHRWLDLEEPVDAAPIAASVPSPVPDAIRAVDQPVSFWLGRNLDLVRKYRLNPLRASRTLAYLSTAMHDAGASCGERAGQALPPKAAVHFAAAEMLEYLFPEEIKGHWYGQAALYASCKFPGGDAQWRAVRRLARQVAGSAMSRALNDGSARIDALARPPQSIALPWKATPPLWSTRPVEPGASRWRHWLVASDTGEQCPPPLTLDAAAYPRQVEKVYQVHRHLTAEQKRIAEDWNLDLGTVTPPGVWVMKVIDQPAWNRLPLIDQTGLASLLTAVMTDAFTACWYVKFKWWTERPLTAIRRLIDPHFLPHVLTPSFPSYTSAHATVSGAAATVLSAAMPAHRDAWQAAAEEAALSRLYGGIHFDFDNREGLNLGRKVGELALSALHA